MRTVLTSTVTATTDFLARKLNFISPFVVTVITGDGRGKSAVIEIERPTLRMQ